MPRVCEARTQAQREIIERSGSSSPQRIAARAGNFENPPGYELLDEIHRGGDERLTLAQIRTNLGTCLATQGELDAAADELNAALLFAEKAPNRPARELAVVFGGIGNLQLQLRRVEEAAI